MLNEFLIFPLIYTCYLGIPALIMTINMIVTIYGKNVDVFTDTKDICYYFNFLIDFYHYDPGFETI